MRKFLYIAGVFLLVLSIYQVIDFVTYKNKREKVLLQKGEETTAQLKNEIDAILQVIQKEGEHLAKLFGSQELTLEEVEKIIKISSIKIKEIQGVTACYEPFAFSEDRELFCPYFDKSTGEFLYVGEKYNYTEGGKKGTAWYTEVRDKGARWVEPYYGAGAEDWFIDYGIPFYFTKGPKKGQVRGTITMSIACSGFIAMVHSMSLGKTGYGIITSTENHLLAFPINEYIGTKSFSEIIEDEDNENVKLAYSRLSEKEKGFHRYFDDVVGDDTFFYYDEIPTSNWGLGLVFYKKSLLQDSRKLNQKYIKLAIFLSLLFIVLLTIFYNRDHLDRGEIWTISILSSVIFLFNIVFIGYLNHTTDISQENESPPIVDLSSLDKIISKQHQKSETLKTPKLTSIPTGIYIHNLEFADSYNVNLGGKIWQKYPLDLLDQVEVGFTLPQLSPFAESAYIEEVNRTEIPAQENKDGYMLVHWEVRVTLRLNLNYADFPFDKRNINIEILPKNINDYLIFTPDLTSYKYTTPDKKSGLDAKIAISGSEVLESYFNYSSESYNGDFGFGEKGIYEDVPVLHFNINLKRKLLNAFITYLVPIVVTIIMVFILLTAIGKSEERQGIVESMAAFFFVLIFSHIDLRKEIVTAELTYIEYFYFIAYSMLLLATYNMVTYSKKKTNLFDYEENLFFKATFFPLMLFVVLFFTFWSFY